MLRRINREFDGTCALNCWVAQPGTISLGAPVHLLDTPLPRPPRGGWMLGRPYLVP
ncbi:hypothetical protein [Streptomyces sp. NBC_01190]|uniref:hypothetical protein n=1 Tax=Streptomyces sp. NBC_01190 TaxID=2903767 RepID=UPI00386B4122|nr:hypothetical protein OG519_30540 [Streptomyces sp. NBC_01190]